MIKEQIMNLISNLDNSLIRDEYKINIYRKYVLPSIRFSLQIHELHTSQLGVLDRVTSRFLKKWAHMPQSASLSLFQHPKLLGIKSISHLSKECKALSFTKQRLEGDLTVNEALDSRIQRESSWSRKSSSCITSQTILDNTLQSLQQGYSVKNGIKKSINNEYALHWDNRIRSYTTQGKMLELFALQENDISWQSMIYNLPKGLLQFAMNAALNTLPSPDNLKEMG